jgi:Na+-transporting NADH:ubiquinone oxidoreductase subunit B
MRALRQLFDAQRKHFVKDGRLRVAYPIYEALDTFMFTPGLVTRGRTHVRDGLDLKRMMTVVVVALLPCIGMALYNTGYQAHLLIEAGGAPIPGLRTDLMIALGLPFSSSHALSCVVHGALYFLPSLIVAFAAGGGVEVASAMIRGHEVNEGYMVTGFLIPLTLPATMPLWMVGLGAAVGTVLGKEIFGGTGMNFLNPALVVRALLFFAYPAQISGDVWIAATAPDGVSSATWLARLAADGSGLPGLGWWDAFVGLVPGSMGETSALACLLGAALLLLTRIGSWRTMAGVVAGTLATSALLNAVGSDTNPMFAVPFHWHAVLGGWAFGMVFMATDPVSSAFTETGKLVYGFGIGVMVVLVRCVNPAYPEGMMLAILFMNMFAPLIDHYVVQANVKRRRLRHGAA